MKSVFVSSVLFSILLVACGNPVQMQSETNEWGESVAEGRKEAEELRSMNDAEEAKYGAEIDAALKDPAKKSVVGLTIKVSANPVYVNLVNRVGQRLVPTSARNNIRYTFQVVESDDVNAFATMGGFVYVNTGLIKIAENEAQLAGVMAHEIAHVAKKHALFAIAKQAERAGWSSGIGGRAGKVLGAMGALLGALPKSRANEFEADELGFLNVRKAGYAADEMIEFYDDVLAKLGAGSKTPTILKTHPETADRIAALKRIRKSSDATGDGAADSHYRAELGK
jgi:predicted Zn-dependent protease